MKGSEKDSKSVGVQASEANLVYNGTYYDSYIYSASDNDPQEVSDTTRQMRKDFDQSLDSIRRDVKNYTTVMSEYLAASEAEVTRLRGQLDALQEEFAADLQDKMTLNSDIVRYRGSWLLADLRVKQLTLALDCFGGDTPTHPATQIPIDASSPICSSSRRPWIDSDAVEVEGENQDEEEADFPRGEQQRSLSRAKKRRR
jgi:hypothetical protein